MDTKERGLEILIRLKNEYPQAKTTLKYDSLFELLVAIVLSAQSTDEQVNRVTAELFKQYNTPQAIAEMDLEELEKLIRGVGLYKNKARSLKKLSKIISAKYQGAIPHHFEQLIELPGVGRKTANVMLSVGFNQPGLGVDTHVHRVTNRLGLVATQQPDKTEIQLKDLIPRELWSEAHHLFIYHGRQICRARKPACSNCVIEDLCKKVFN